jgi:hypothetical protein
MPARRSARPYALVEFETEDYCANADQDRRFALDHQADAYLQHLPDAGLQPGKAGWGER